VRIARVQILARRVFSSDDAVAGWLQTPARSLGGLAPIDLLDTDIGAREVESLVHGIAFGNVM
jgi:putative toxin-antitoxin system antitoxin component (TIGR02293 family)